MSLTEIENEIFSGRNIIHDITSIFLSPNELHLSITPLGNDIQEIRAEFKDFKLISLESFEVDEEPNLPWQILGFESEKISETRWKFYLVVEEIAFAFTATWPTVYELT